jgi:glucose-1-phosphate thymidylyltransferase
MAFKGVILAGGSGTRLRPLTEITNKHLLPLYNKPVIFHAVEKLVSAGVEKIMVVASPRYIEDFVSVLGSGVNWRSAHTGKQVQIIYGIQNEPSGIADGLWIAKDFVGTDNVVLHLGDNIIFDDIRGHINDFRGGAKVFIKKVSDPERFGVAVLDKKGRVTEIIEKPKTPPSNYAVSGIYLYDNSVFERMVGMPKSERGEYEITWVNNKFIETGELEAAEIKGEWFDVGTFDSLLEASHYVKRLHEKGNS